MASQTDPRSPDYDPSAARLAAEDRGRRSGAYEERRKQSTKRKETVASEKAKSARRGRGEGRAAAQREHRERLSDPTGPVARQAKKSYKAGQDDVIAFFRQLQDTANLTVPNVQTPDLEVRPQTGQTTLSGRRVSFGTPQTAPSGGGFLPVMNRQNGARFIMLLVATSALAVLVRGSRNQPTKEKVGAHTITVPAGMRQYAAIVVVGVIALVVNEFSPAVGVALAAAMTLDVVVNSGFIGKIGTVIAPQQQFGQTILPPSNSPTPPGTPPGTIGPGLPQGNPNP